MRVFYHPSSSIISIRSSIISEMSFSQTPQQITCSVGRKHKTKCGLSSRYPSQKEVLSITECKSNTTAHLRRLKISRVNLSEKELILSRVGVFDDASNTMTVCPKQRNSGHLLAPFSSMSTSFAQSNKAHWIGPGNVTADV